MLNNRGVIHGLLGPAGFFFVRIYCIWVATLPRKKSPNSQDDGCLHATKNWEGGQDPIFDSKKALKNLMVGLTYMVQKKLWESVNPQSVKPQQTAGSFTAFFKGSFFRISIPKPPQNCHECITSWIYPSPTKKTNIAMGKITYIISFNRKITSSFMLGFFPHFHSFVRSFETGVFQVSKPPIPKASPFFLATVKPGTMWSSQNWRERSAGHLWIHGECQQKNTWWIRGFFSLSPHPMWIPREILSWFFHVFSHQQELLRGFGQRPSLSLKNHKGAPIFVGGLAIPRMNSKKQTGGGVMFKNGNTMARNGWKKFSKICGKMLSELFFPTKNASNLDC